VSVVTTPLKRYFCTLLRWVLHFSKVSFGTQSPSNYMSWIVRWLVYLLSQVLLQQEKCTVSTAVLAQLRHTCARENYLKCRVECRIYSSFSTDQHENICKRESECFIQITQKYWRNNWTKVRWSVWYVFWVQFRHNNGFMMIIMQKLCL